MKNLKSEFTLSKQKKSFAGEHDEREKVFFWFMKYSKYCEKQLMLKHRSDESFKIV